MRGSVEKAIEGPMYFFYTLGLGVEEVYGLYMGMHVEEGGYKYHPMASFWRRLLLRILGGFLKLL